MTRDPNLSRKLFWLLRHGANEQNLSMDEAGWTFSGTAPTSTPSPGSPATASGPATAPTSTSPQPSTAKVGKRVAVEVLLAVAPAALESLDLPVSLLAKHQSLLAPDHARILRTMRAEAELAAAIGNEVEERDSLRLRLRPGGGLMATRTGTKPNADLAYLCRAMKAPSLAAAVGRLGERARSEGWTHEEFPAACLEREVAARQHHGGEGRIKTARFPGRKTLEDFDFHRQRPLKRDRISYLGTLDFVTAKENVVFLGPSGTGKTHLAIGLGIRACQAGHRVAFGTSPNGSPALAEAHTAGRLHAELTRPSPLVIIDEVGYIACEAEAANLFFQFVPARYERASVIVTSNKPCSRWGEVFGDAVVAAAMIDRLVHHAEVVST